MMKDNELWLKKIKERLEDHSEPLPAAGWERLEKGLLPVPSVAPKRIVFRRRAVAAAAAVLVAVSLTGLWFMQNPTIDDVHRSVKPALAVTPDEMPQPIDPATGTEEPEPIKRMPEQGTSYRQPLVAQQQEKEDMISKGGKELPVESRDVICVVEVNKDIPPQQGTGKIALEREEKEQVAENSSSSPEKKERYLPSDNDRLYALATKKSSAKNKNWSIGLSVGNMGGLTALNNEVNGGGFMSSTPGGYGDGPMYVGRLDLANDEDGVFNIPEGQELVFENGIPYLLENEHPVKSIKHKQPVGFGISVRKALPKNFSVETGVTYTMLSSEIIYEGSAEKTDQKLHYIGIPVRANWSFVNQKRLNVYVSAGGAVEKCVYGKVGSEKEAVKPLQFSVMSAIGAQYNVSNRVGLYVEPGVAYFFDDDSDMETIRKENPANFTLQAGIRLTY